VLVEMAEGGLARRLAPEGRLVVAGLLLGQEEEVQEAFQRNGLVIVGRRQMEDWVALEAARQPVIADGRL